MTMPNYTSWGRTRRPKTLANRDHAVSSKETAAAVAVIAVGNLNDSLNDAVAGHNGYTTENQRFLHLLVGNGTANNASAAARTVTLYGYMYASGKWAPLLDEAGNAITLTAPDNDGTEALAGRKSRVFNIFGIDRIAFIGVTADTKCWAACSTF